METRAELRTNHLPGGGFDQTVGEATGQIFCKPKRLVRVDWVE